MQDIKTLHQLAVQALNQRDFVRAHSLCVQLVKQDAMNHDAYFLLAMINLEVGQIAKAIKLIEKANVLGPRAEYFAYLAKCHSLRGESQRVLDALDNAPMDKLSNPLALDTIGVALSRIGLHEKALTYFTKALALEKSNAHFYYNFGVSSKFAGKFEDARAHFEQAISIEPNFHQAHFALSDLGGISADNHHIPRLQLTAKRTNSVDGAMHIAHALAKEYEALKDYSNAFDVLEKAKSAKLASIGYQFAHDAAFFDCVEQTQFAELGSESTPQGDASHQPIFVLGMPRSGTTLVERILSNHSDVLSAGELQDFGIAVKELAQTSAPTVLDTETLRKAMHIDPAQIGQRYIQRTQAIVGDTPHFVDKLPFNFFYIGLIRRALPNAKIICLLRDPMDTCIGNYRQLFSLNSPYYAYAYNLQNIGHFYGRFHRLVHRWQAASTDNFMLLDYQDLVRNPQSNIRDLLTFCNLPWQDECLHVERNQAPVSTASKVQVRQPINQSSIGRWKHFQEHTQGLEAFFHQQQILFES
jgi:tetratricopeptide (TPR) repeat protein